MTFIMNRKVSEVDILFIVIVCRVNMNITVTSVKEILLVNQDGQGNVSNGAYCGI